jgi:hypothetical protein
MRQEKENAKINICFSKNGEIVVVIKFSDEKSKKK